MGSFLKLFEQSVFRVDFGNKIVLETDERCKIDGAEVSDDGQAFDDDVVAEVVIYICSGGTDAVQSYFHELFDEVMLQGYSFDQHLDQVKGLQTQISTVVSRLFAEAVINHNNQLIINFGIFDETVPETFVSCFSSGSFEVTLGHSDHRLDSAFSDCCFFISHKLNCIKIDIPMAEIYYVRDY